MQVVNFKRVLVCDVRVTEFEGKDYYSLLIYSDNQLSRISITSGQVELFRKYIGKYISLEAELKIYDGKLKYKYTGNEIKEG